MSISSLPESLAAHSFRSPSDRDRGILISPKNLERIEKLKMSDLKAIRQIEEQLTRDRRRLEELAEKARELLENIPGPGTGFHAATEGVKLRSERVALQEAIRHNEQLLVMAKKQ